MVRPRGVVIDYRGHRLFVDGREVRIAKMEMQVLGILHANEGRLVRPDGFAEIWDDKDIDWRGSLRQFVHRVRRKFGPYRKAIHHVNYHGYYLEFKKKAA